MLDLVGRFIGPLTIVDVGAMWLGADDVVYRKLLKPAGRARVIGFEPVQAECDRLNALAMPGHSYLPWCIGDGSAGTFHQTRDVMSSSLLEPNRPLLSMFQGLDDGLEVVSRTPVQTRRLDDLPGINAMDFLKLDVQGAELAVLRGAAARLSQTLVIDTEIEFLPMYLGQPLFAEIDQFLRAAGFVFHAFNHIAGRPFKPIQLGANPHDPIRQTLWGNAVYVRDFTRLGELADQDLLKTAAILHEVYDSWDLVHVLLNEYDRRTRAGLAPVYLTRFKNGFR